MRIACDPDFMDLTRAAIQGLQPQQDQLNGSPQTNAAQSAKNHPHAALDILNDILNPVFKSHGVRPSHSLWTNGTANKKQVHSMPLFPQALTRQWPSR